MKITQIETFANRRVCFVRVTTEDGSEGFGQTAPTNGDITATVLHRQVAPHVLGMDALSPEEISTRCIDRNLKFPWSYVCRALGGIDTALWDLRGKVEDKPVCELIGGSPKSITAYGSSMQRDIQPADEGERLKRLRDEKGFRAFKIRAGSVCGHDADQWPGRTEELIPTVRKAVGDDVTLLIDGNSCYTPKRAIEVGRLLEDHDYGHFEEPCPYWELEWTAEVAAALDIPVAGGEQDNDLAQWRRMMAMKAVDIVQPDLCYVGGLTRSLEVVRMAQEANLPVVPHSANPSMVTVFTLHLMAAIPNAGPHLEFSIESSSWTESLFEPGLTVIDGMVEVPSGPGWGVTLNQSMLEGMERCVSKAES